MKNKIAENFSHLPTSFIYKFFCINLFKKSMLTEYTSWNCNFLLDYGTILFFRLYSFLVFLNKNKRNLHSNAFLILVWNGILG